MGIYKNGIWKQNELYENPNLPKEYQQVEYIEADGGQYIVTNLVPTKNVNFKAVAETTSTGSTWDGALFGIRSYSGASDTFVLWFNHYANATKPRISLAYANQSLPNSDYKDLKHSFYFKNQKLEIDNQLISTFTSQRTEWTGSIILFGLYNGTSLDGRKFKGKLYELKFFDGETLIGNFIPCYRKSDNKPGLYDSVNQIFYINQGTGDFITGANVPLLPEGYQQIEYIESNGTQYIDTGIKGNAIHCYELAWLKKGVNRQLMGYGGSSREYWGLQSITTGKIECGGAITYTPTVDITQKQNYIWEYNYENSINNIYLNNELILSTTPNPAVTNTSIKLFNIYANANNYVNTIKLYSYMIKNWENQVLAYYLPAKRISDNKIGLYEIISQTFVLSGNGNDFISGLNIDNKTKIYNNSNIEANSFIEL